MKLSEGPFIWFPRFKFIATSAQLLRLTFRSASPEACSNPSVYARIEQAIASLSIHVPGDSIVRPDLKDLPISKTELKRLSGLDIEAVNHFSIPSLISLDSGPDSPGLIRYLPFMVAFAIGLTYPVAIALLNLTFPVEWLFLSAYLVLGLFLTKLIQFFWVKKHVGASLPGLLYEVERFNDIIRVIDINDRLEEVGNPDVHLRDRKQVIQALQLTQEDLIRALRTERILRKHKTFIARNPEIFANNLTALAALQVTDKASEHGRLLNEALQIALSANEEIGKLSRRPPCDSSPSPDST